MYKNGFVSALVAILFTLPLGACDKQQSQEALPDPAAANAEAPAAEAAPVEAPAAEAPTAPVAEVPATPTAPAADVAAPSPAAEGTGGVVVAEGAHH